MNDEEGTEMPDEAAAHAHAIGEAREVACESVAQGHLNLDHFIEVAGDDGRPLFKVHFGEAIAVIGRA